MEEAKLPSNSTFNHAAAAENLRNLKFIKKFHPQDGITTLQIGKEVTYKGVPVDLLSSFEKKKLENIVLFMFVQELNEMPIITYA